LRDNYSGRPTRGQQLKLPGASSPPRVDDVPCPKRGMPMRLGFVEPLDEPGHERRLYECLSCKRSVNVVVDFPEPRIANDCDLNLWGSLKPSEQSRDLHGGPIAASGGRDAAPVQTCRNGP
jgi:hypothetical protein